MQLTLLPLPTLTPLPLPAIFSPWFPMDRNPWEDGYYEIKDPDGITWAERFHYSALTGWSEALPATAVAWRGRAAP